MRTKKPQRQYAKATSYDFTLATWARMCRDYNAHILKNGESPSDFPNEAVAFETRNFGWILSKPDKDGYRRISVQW